MAFLFLVINIVVSLGFYIEDLKSSRYLYGLFPLYLMRRKFVNAKIVLLF